MPPSDKPSVKGRAAYVEEVDENGDRVRGSRRTSSKKKSDKGDRSSRSSKEKKSRSDSGYSSHAANLGSDASSPPLSRAEIADDEEEPSTSREERQSRRKSTSGSPTKTQRKSSKPPSVHRNGVRSVQLPPPLELPIRSKNDPGFYGVSSTRSTPVPGPTPRSTMMPNTSRPARPQSFYSGMPQPNDNRPPLARSAYYVAPNPVPLMPTSFPPASPSTWMNYSSPPLQSDSYFAAQPQSRARLAERFTPQNGDPIQRTASASGINGLTQSYYSYNGYEENSNSIRRRSKELEDLRAMPPPTRPYGRRPSIRQVTTSDGRHEPSPFVPYSDEPEDEAERWGRRLSRTIRREDAPRRRSSVSQSRAYTYDQSAPARVRIETPNGRRKSYCEEQRPRSTNYEDKVGEAARYQEDVGGGPPVNLTAAALRQSQRPSGSSRSTRSSGSKDDSDFKRSVTTRTTTSKGGQESDDFTIRFKGAATFNIAGTEIKCGDDGAEVNIVRRKSLRNGSEQSGSEYGTVQEDRQSRGGTRPVTLSRSTSKTGYSDPTFNKPWRPSHPREGWI